jgi:hypothetical protein
MVPTPQPCIAKQVGQSVRVRVELAERHLLLGRLQYQRRLVTTFDGMLPGIHAFGL